MYYFYNSPKIILDDYVPAIIHGITSNKSFTLCACFNSKEIFIYENKTTSLITYYQRSSESTDVYGDFSCLEWNSDSSQIAFGTSKGFLLLFSLTISRKDLSLPPDKEIFFSKEGFSTSSFSMNGKIHLLDVLAFNFKINSLCLYREDLLVATEDGALCRIRWDGRIIYNQQLTLTNIAFFNDLEFSKANNLSKLEAQCRRIEWFPSLSGLIVLFQNGKSAFLHIPNHKLICEQITGVWAEHLRHANCFAVNFKFRSVAYGGKMGEAVIYKTDEETGALRLQHKLKISCSEYPDADKITGAVTVLKWSPDNFCLAMCWENKAFSLWSVQGSLLFSSLGNKCGIGMNLLDLDWGCEGYSLWTVKRPSKSCDKYKIVVFQMARSSLTTNPTKDNHQHLLLLTSMSAIVGPRKSLSSCGIPLEHVTYPDVYMSSNWPVKYAALDAMGTRLAISGKNGFAIYLMNTKKWRLFGNETQEKTLEVTGGMVWYKNIVCMSCFDNKQERFEIRLYNSLIKIDDSVCFIYPVTSQILMINIFDNALVALSIDGLVTLYEVKYEPSDNILSIEFLQTIPLENYIEFAVCVVSLNLSSLHTDLNLDNNKYQSTDQVQYQSLLINYSGHLLMFQRDLMLPPTRNSVQVNKTGRNSFFKLPFSDNLTVARKTIPFTGPLVVAYDVEIMWLPLIYEHHCQSPVNAADLTKKMYTMENALWLNCGAHGLRVWLPLNAAHMLLGNEKKTKHTFLSKRIMLTCKIYNFYPLVVLNKEALLMASSNEFSTITFPGFSYKNLPLAVISKNRHLFLQHIIKQLLRINLGIHALDLTYSLCELPYFDHALELLLHEVLEEEATSKEPIPDPLLPRVVGFIQEFPNFLRTLSQCARKTELALWSYLFASAGNPKNLFENCLLNNELDTAASFLIILQNTEHPLMSQKHATLLLDAALHQSKWVLVKDLIRFLKNIAINDGNQNESSTYKSLNDSSISSLSYRSLHKRRYQSGGTLGLKTSRQYSISKSNKDFENSKSQLGSSSQMKNSVLNNSVDESSSDELFEELSPDGKYNFNSVSAFSKPAISRRIATNHSRRIKRFSQSSVENSCPSPKMSSSDSIDIFTSENCKYSHFEKEVDMILTKFAHQQFQEYRLYNLAEFVVNSHFKENQFVLWMNRERLFCYKITNPAQAFQRLHGDFKWPLRPISCTGSLNHVDDASDDSSIRTSVRTVPISNAHNTSTEASMPSHVILSNHHQHEDPDSESSLNRRRLKYVAQLMHRTEYWEWVFLLLLMLEDHDEMTSSLHYYSSTIRSLDQLDQLSTMIEFITAIAKWNLEEQTRYVKIVTQWTDTIIPSLQDRMADLRNPRPQNIIEANTDLQLWSGLDGPKEDSLVLSPIIKHCPLTLGQLTIDTDLIEDHSHQDNVTPLDLSPAKCLLPDSIANGMYHFPPRPRPKRRASIKESATVDQLRAAFNLCESDCHRDGEVDCDVLVATELEESSRSSIGCSLS